MSSNQQRNDRFEGYVPVSRRVEQFYERFPEGRILTAIVEHHAETGFVLMRAEVFRNADDALPAATGHAFEIRGEGHVNRTSHIENCETGAVGRALANLGFEVKEQPQRPAQRQPQQPPGPRAVPPPAENPKTSAETLSGRIMTALEILGRSEEDLNGVAEQKFGMQKGGDWSDLPATTRQEILAFLNRKIDERHAGGQE